MSACPFGAIADKSQIFQLIQAIKKGDKIVAAVAPAIAGQFGPKANLGKIKTALIKLGFADMYEVAEGADMGCIAEAHHYVNEVATGNLPFLLTSCCPAWAVLAKKQFPDFVAEVSQELTPMVATARKIKEKDDAARVVFIGPCAAKKLEASRRTIRSFVDFVLTFEELSAMFAAKDINPETLEETPVEQGATGAGRGYAVAGGVANAIEQTVKQYYPDTQVNIYHAEGLADCKKILLQAKAGKISGCLIEGMGCPGGCVAGVGTVIPPEKAKVFVDMGVKASSESIPAEDLIITAERLTKMK
jgi:iron only hydrogenase large subunit-like protein